MNFRIADTEDEKDVKFIFENLDAYNQTKLQPDEKNARPLCVYYEGDEGKILAGLVAKTHGNWMFTRFLYVSDELRGQGVGSQLLKAAEDEARARGCKYSYLETCNFQAPNVYPKYGYREIFTLENFPVHGTKHVFTKEL